MEPRLVARYGSPEGAAAYRRKYERSLFRRMSNRRELAVVRRALARAGVSGHVLDCPCGAGRLVPTILERAERVTAADLSEAMVREARDALSDLGDRVAFAVASADALPFGDGAFDAAVCHRLLHHVPTPEARAAILRELARVTRSAVVLSFSDRTTAKARWQRARGVERRRIALTPDEIRAEAAAHGLRPIGDPIRLCGWTSLVAVQAFRVGAAT